MGIRRGEPPYVCPLFSVSPLTRKRGRGRGWGREYIPVYVVI